MMTQDLNSQYANLPAEQRKLFLDFRENHPYTSITFQNRDGSAQIGRYIACGTDEKVLVFLHGALVEPDMWFYPILKLEQTFRIIAPHFLPEKMGALEATDFILTVLRKEQVTNATFIGMSFGGGVAQYLAEKHPQLIDKIVLTHTGILGREDSTTRIEKLKKLIRFIPLFLIKMILKKRVEDFPGSEWNEFHKAYFLGINARITKRIFLDYLDSMLRFTIETAGFSAADQRNWQDETVLLGTRGDTDTFQYFEQLKTLYPQAEHYVFEEEGGHHMIFLFPEKYTQVLSRYVA